MVIGLLFKHLKRMFKYLINIINTFLCSGSSRTIKAKKNIVAGFGVKGVAMILGLVKVPIILNYLNAEKYGIWLTIASIVDWVHYFDLGIGHGLRNKFAEAIAEGDKVKAKKLVSTAYYYITIIFGIVGIVLIPLLFLINWQKVLNTTLVSQQELLFSVLFVLVMFILRFILYQISEILKAVQRPALSDIFLPIASCVTLICVFLLRFVSKDSLFLACVAISAPPVIILLFANLYFFHKEYKEFSPSLKDIDNSLFKDTFTLGLKFFIIQLSGLVMFASSNIILTQLVNPSEVTLYNISRQYFNLPFMVFGIILSPFWSAITDAYVRGEYDWIKKSMRSLLIIGGLFVIGEFMMLIISPWAYRVWIGDSIEIPFMLSAVTSIMFVFYLIGAPFSHFLNGTGKLELSTRIGIIQVLLFLPIAILLTKVLGAFGLVLSMIIVNSIPQIVLGPLQYKMLIQKKAKGIWNK